MKNTKKWGKIILQSSFVILFFCLSLLFICNNSVKAKEEDKKVLFISSYSESFPSVPLELAGIKSVLQSTNITLDTEYMDTKRFDTVEHQKIFYQMLKYKLDKLITYDAIIVGDDSALEFVMDHQEEMFEGIPIVFLGINDFRRVQKANIRENITGVVEDLAIKENIETALKFNKTAKKVVAIVDDTITGQGDNEQFYRAEDSFPDLSFSDINSSEYTTDELEQMLEQIEKDTILLYLSMNVNKSDTTITIEEATAMLREHVKVPIYRAEVGGVGDGILGGKVVSYEDAGKVAAEMVLKILTGTDIEYIAIEYINNNQYVFDYKIIQEYKIDKSVIPKDATFINKKLGFYEQNKNIIWTTLSIIGILSVLSVILIIDNVKRRKIEKKLVENNQILSETYDELTSSEEELRAQYETIQEHSNIIEILNQKYQIAIDSTGIAVWELNIYNKMVSVSKNFGSLVNKTFDEQEEVSQFLDKLLTPEDKEILIQEYYAYKQGEKNEINVQLSILDKDLCVKWILVRGKGFLSTSGYFRMMHGIILDITKMKEQDQYIKHLANHDFLTNLPNRMSFMNKLKKELDHDKPGAILLLDLDNFKAINDTLGHIYGDEILKEIAMRLIKISSEHLFVSRFGGDEFLILISMQEDEEKIKQSIDMIKDEFKRAFVVEDKENHINFSMGISKYPFDGEDVYQLLMKADTAMYKAKHTGRNNYLYYHEGMKEELRDKTEIEVLLRRALKEDGFYLVYQPQVDTFTGEIVGFEALLRMKEKDLAPYRFISVAEETGLIVEIGRWVAKEAINQMARWKESGLKYKSVAINYSNKQLQDENFVSYVSDILKECGVPAKYLEIEITESIFLQKTEKTLECLEDLKKIGVRIALDDFGTGYSSLSYLTFIPVTKIKLDKSLIDKFLGEEDVKVIECLILLAHSLNLEITAEGVEEIGQYNLLKKGGCNYIQGYLFSRPLIVEEAEKIYNNNLIA